MRQLKTEREGQNRQTQRMRHETQLKIETGTEQKYIVAKRVRETERKRDAYRRPGTR